MKILNTSPISGALLKEGIASRVPGIAYINVDAHGYSEERLAAEAADADIMVGDYTGATRITRSIIMAAGKLRLIQQPSVGYNNIDIAACKEFNIPVANTPGGNDIAVAEHTVMLALACLKKLTYFNAKTHEGEWLFEQRREKGVFEINSRTYGLLGMGRTAKAVAERLIPFGVRLLYYDKIRLSADDEKRYRAVYAPLEELLKTADVVSLHLPLMPETEGIINASRLSLMKPSAMLINVGRGPLVDEAALAQALRSNKLAGAAVDVFSQEPPPRNHPLFGLENVILTPHLAGATQESAVRIINMVFDNVGRAMRGEEPLWLLTP